MGCSIFVHFIFQLFSANIKKMDMDEIVTFLQERLAEDFGTDDDLVIEQLKVISSFHV